MPVHIEGKSMRGSDPRLYAYILAHQAPEHEVLARLREVTRQMPNSFMQITPEQGQFMAFLLKLIGARTVLEVGTFTGYSTLGIALALPTDGRVVTCEVNDEWVQVGKRHWEDAGVSSKIDVRLGPALDTLHTLQVGGERFDAAFIDADKENYERYYDAALRLVREGGIIMLDNMLRLGRVADPEDREPATTVIRRLNERIAHEQHLDRVLLPISDGLTLVRRR